MKKKSPKYLNALCNYCNLNDLGFKRAWAQLECESVLAWAWHSTVTNHVIEYADVYFSLILKNALQNILS